jgi:hypothetical protein
MEKLTAEDVALMTVTERLEAIAQLSPEMDQLIQHGRNTGMCDLQIFEHFQIAQEMKPH